MLTTFLIVVGAIILSLAIVFLISFINIKHNNGVDKYELNKKSKDGLAAIIRENYGTKVGEHFEKAEEALKGEKINFSYEDVLINDTKEENLVDDVEKKDNKNAGN